MTHDVRPVLLALGGSGDFDLSPWADVRRVDATTDGPWELPVISKVDAPPTVLIRPDGHVAWTGTLTEPALPEALTTWSGLPALAPPRRSRSAEPGHGPSASTAPPRLRHSVAKSR